jgi:hypothetical protein
VDLAFLKARIEAVREVVTTMAGLPIEDMPEDFFATLTAVLS